MKLSPSEIRMAQMGLRLGFTVEDIAADICASHDRDNPRDLSTIAYAVRVIKAATS